MQNYFIFVVYINVNIVKNNKKAIKGKGVALNYFQIAALAAAFKREDITIKRWAKQNSDLLKLPLAESLIHQYKNTPSEIPSINI